LIGPGGATSRVADVSAGRRRLEARAPVSHGGREAILRRGGVVADLRRPSLLMLPLFRFAGALGRVFSKEELVELIWRLSYHPLRHDAALFTNIMRARRLLGPDGAELLQCSEEGYRFVPRSDFLFVTAPGLSAPVG